ncbi:FlgO family outer membrane protein [Maridesulfovibrio bastinii]|uniref:FlgO family outer membrane protein n=1 Tax=Maridesulfovibrio bastinii TaxID=47157 RepID=UPI0003F834A0|nr:FlgO family outer membrane protein [Maridesulfovibrio bastinii]
MHFIRLLTGICFCLFFLCTFSATAHAGFFGPPENLKESGEELADELSSSDSLENKRIAVLEFKSHGAAYESMLGKRIAEYVSSAMVGIKDCNWDIVERMEIAIIRNEMEEHKDDVFNFGDWMGKRLQADLLLMGSYSITGKDIAITVRVVNPSNGSTVASASIIQPVNKEIEQLSRTRKPRTDFAETVEDITAILTDDGSKRTDDNPQEKSSHLKIYKVQGAKKVAFKKNEISVFDVGAKMGFSVIPPINSKLYILNYDPAADRGEAILLYPIPGLDPASFHAGRTYQFPEFVSGGVTSYDVEEPLGRMVFKVIGVDDSLKMDLTGSLELRDGYYWLNAENLPEFMDNLSSIPDNSWWSEDVEFWIQ